MRTIAISSGHGKHVSGALPPYMDEVTEARRVVAAVANELSALGVPFAGPFNDDVSTSQNENLNRITNWHNAQTRDLDVSVHFNCNVTTSSPVGTECLYVTQQALAGEVAAAIAIAGGLKDRGAKYRSDLFVLNNTEKPCILIEVCFVDSKADRDLYNRNFAQICRAIAESISGVSQPERPDRPERPPPGPDAGEGHPTISVGDNGPEVEELQQKLNVVIPDGDFGGITEAWVKAFQGAAKLTADGIAGPNTWAAVDDLARRMSEGDPPLPKPLEDRIYTIAQQSEIADYSWKDRGVPPHGYIAGMAMCWAYALRSADAGLQELFCQPQGNTSTDALAYYEPTFQALGMRNDVHGWATARHLFVMLIGLGPRESSGKYFEGRDLSASNVQSETCEAGLHQTSWNIHTAHPTIPPLLPQFWSNPNGFVDTFKQGLSPTKDNLDSYGTGDGIRYQFLSRLCPLFHVLVTGAGLRTRRQHWGPINSGAVEIKREADQLLEEIQMLVQSEGEA